MSKLITFETVRRPKSPNTCLVAPDDLCKEAQPDFAAPVFEMSANALYAKIINLIQTEKRWSDLTEDTANHQLHFVARTAFFGFRDDVDIRVIAQSDTTSTIAAYSRSRVGHSDLGANRKRMEKIITQLTAN